MLGNDNDAKTVIKANIVEDMSDISIELGVDYLCFIDSAYPQSKYLAAILKCQQGGQLTAQQSRFNTLMGSA